MKKRIIPRIHLAAVALLLVSAPASRATIDGRHIDGFTAGSSATMNLTAIADHAGTGDGGSVLIWGLRPDSYPGFTSNTTDHHRAMYPGPTMIVNQGATVTVTLKRDPSIPINVSLVFPGQVVTASGGFAGKLTQESTSVTDVVTYTFTASQSGTFWYHGATRPELEIEMGMFGALIVRPASGGSLIPAPAKTTGGSFTGIAYQSSLTDTAWDREYLLLLSDMDPRVHTLLEFQGYSEDLSTDAGKALAEYLANPRLNYFFVNGRTAPDTLSDPDKLWLPVQPYNALVRMHPGEQILMREISAGRESHPLHHHGNHSLVIGRDGQMLSSNGGYADLAYSVFTTMAIPGKTYDEIFTWTGQFLGWDAYGPDSVHKHTCNGRTFAQGPSVASSNVNVAPSDFDPATFEYCPDHGKPIPVALPGNQELIFGDSFSGSPYLGAHGSMPPGNGPNNVFGGYFFMWHSHTERELTNNNIFPGGMLDMLIVEAPWVAIP